jgi:hypothetical protein
VDPILDIVAALYRVAARATDDDATAFFGKRFDRMSFDLVPGRVTQL